ncbi:MAG: CocE/NonD family hydrolase [Ectothiorhodospiraceae bacterium AqS1]|nr:CocE/NonD family hydrolase [Ectothiorhodospiraceae bacterium AqS1]
MPDGVGLSASIWLPAAGAPTPAILEYIPYRKRDLVRARDERNHPYFAAHGYACLRVDMRGSGDSEGAMPDMYTCDELDDARCVIEWIAEQPWCNGRVGIFGTSWGGTAALQAAIDAPDALQAVIANCATVDRFEDDIHWMGGCLLTDSLEWGATLPAILACPPDRATLGERWMDIWKTRLRNTSFPFERWAKNDRRGEYWRHGSVRFQADRLRVPILAIGGWSDRYSNSVMRLVRARPDLCRGIVGPWGHHYPDQGEPGPAIGFQDLALKWWDHWLKSADSAGDIDWPSLQLWRREFDPPQNRLRRRNGRWIAFDLPTRSPRDPQAEGQAEAEATRLYLAGDDLPSDSSQPPSPATLSFNPPTKAATLAIPFDLGHGECAGDTGYFGRVGGIALDQAPDDKRSLRFDTSPLTEAVDLIGHVTLSLDLEIEAMPAQIACRLCDVAQDGRSNLVSRTVLRLDLDDDLDDSRDLPHDELLGKAIPYRIVFPATAYRFEAGNRIRLAFGASYWPLVWPVPRPTEIHIRSQGAHLSLPNLQIASLHRSPLLLPAPKDLPEAKRHHLVSSGELQRTPPVNSAGIIRSSRRQPLLTTRFDEIDLEFAFETTADYEIGEDDPSAADCRISHRLEIRRSDGTALVSSRIRMSAQPAGYKVHLELSVIWNEESFTERRPNHKRPHCLFVGIEDIEEALVPRMKSPEIPSYKSYEIPGLCGRDIRFAPNPEMNIVRRDSNAIRVHHLSMNPDMGHTDMAAVVGGKIRIVLPIDAFEAFRNPISILSNDDAVAAYISHIGEIPHQPRGFFIESALQEPIRLRYSIQPAKTFLSQVHREKIDPLIASQSGALIVHPSFPNLPDGVDTDGLSRFGNEGIGGKGARADQLRASDPKLGAPFALATEGHRQDKADIVGELGGLVDKGQGEPCPVSEGRVADDRIMRSVKRGLPSAIVLADEVGAPGNDLDSDPPTVGKQVVKSAHPRRGVDQGIARDIRMILAHDI